MAKKSKKKKRKGSPASKTGGEGAASEGNGAQTAPPAAASLGTGRVLRKKVQKPSAKEQAALAKKAARAKWSERMTSEGR